ncbi:TonB-dependent siderophore receptor [Sinorhizobium meliloti]|uniref:TonB-dependent siderophore receptor n=1 Tax=Rhizobium meliloti TaxID=382 RepID=UPI000400B04D|nr:TonB-dependent siderophore receptor [Sinorhizobium meliloti]MDW9357962.1 TonB-dependent siderophore receptor [Sinorhizobium meliloti]MDW9657151.1 TonB-dependent siderophore receptor [Sinorhizobium meliloti]MDW9917032.1 TonB-dependent siderophore receptor [Sinorhizobium meliloti]MDW9941975.1 TonB-dependent siderophore receptor [Sinorhizobium meliloti]MDW9948384.1 TonB-dependent siderophore receptor [Sinorhizobium meliloti]
MPSKSALRLPLIRLALAGTSALALVATAQAQEAEQETVSNGDSTALETLVVNGSGGVITAEGYVGTSSATGAKIDTPFLETPQSISTVTEQQLKDRNPQTLLETLAYTPGTRVGAYGFDPRFDAFFVRGFDVTYSGVFRDNLRQPAAVDSIFKNEPYGLEGVSILRGPSSALYGATGAGGLYNLITKRPTEDTLREVQVQYGSHDRYQGQFDFSGPVNENDPVYYRLTGLLRDADTEQVGLADDRAYIAPAFTWKPDEDTKLTVLGEYSRTNSGGTATYYNDPLTGEATDIFAGNPDFNDSVQKQGRVGYEFEHRLNDTFVFRQNARVSTLNIDADWAFAYAPNAADPTLLDSSAGTYDERLTAFVIDNQLEAKFDTGAIEHTLLAGVDYTKLRFRALDGRGVSPPLDTKNPTQGRPVDPIDFNTRTVQDQWQLGTYLQDQIRYDAWTLTVGGRYDWVSTDTDTTDLATDSLTTVSQKDKEFSGRIGLTYQTDFGLAPYISYSTAFTPNAGINRETNQPFKPTESEQQEIGVKYLLPNSNTLITAALFNIDQKNGLYLEASGDTAIQVQRGKLRSRGFEIEANTSLDNGISLTASYAYTDVKIIQGPSGTIGNYVSSAPQHMASIWAHYTLPEDGPFYGFSLGGGARFVGSSYGNDQNTFKNSSRVLLDASVGYDFAAIDQKYEGLHLQVNATNLFDRREAVCTAGYCHRDQGRTVIGSLRYNW